MQASARRVLEIKKKALRLASSVVLSKAFIASRAQPSDSARRFSTETPGVRARCVSCKGELEQLGGRELCFVKKIPVPCGDAWAFLNLQRLARLVGS